MQNTLLAMISICVFLLVFEYWEADQQLKYEIEQRQNKIDQQQNELTQQQEIAALLSELMQCKYDELERTNMYSAVQSRAKFPFPLNYCEGERSEQLLERLLESYKGAEFEVFGSHFELDGYGAALILSRTPNWFPVCESLELPPEIPCKQVVLGQSVSESQRLAVITAQDTLAAQQDIPILVDYILMPLKLNDEGAIRPNWLGNEGAQRANLALATKIGVDLGELKIHEYSQQLDLLEQKTLPEQYMGVFYYATPELIDFIARPESQYSFPLRNAASGRGHKVSTFRAVKGVRKF